MSLLPQDNETAILPCRPSLRLFVCFLLFGMLISMQYSVVITAASDLVGNHAPGWVLFAYTLPSVLVRTVVPFVSFPELHTKPAARLLARLPGALKSPTKRTTQINYTHRIALSAFCSFAGLQLLAWARPVPLRLLGVVLASVSSNLGDMSFLQLTSHYPSRSALTGYTVGGGLAAVIGAVVYTLLTTHLGFRGVVAVGAVGVVPTAILMGVYLFLLPAAAAAAGERERAGRGAGMAAVGFRAKVRIVAAVFWPWLAPLAVVMAVENITLQGVLPTLLFHLPFTRDSTRFPGILNGVVRSTRDFYPLYVTVFQLSLCVGRALIGVAVMPGSAVARWGAVAFLGAMMAAQVGESISLRGASGGERGWYGAWGVSGVEVGMGVVGGWMFSDTYWRVGKAALPCGVSEAVGQEEGEEEGEGLLGGGGRRGRVSEGELREFLLSTVAVPDTVAVLVASLVAMVVQPELCRMQMDSGRGLCWKEGEGHGS